MDMDETLALMAAPIYAAKLSQKFSISEREPYPDEKAELRKLALSEARLLWLDTVNKVYN